jgi:hypothetical protein
MDAAAAGARPWDRATDRDSVTWTASENNLKIILPVRKTVKFKLNPPGLHVTGRPGGLPVGHCQYGRCQCLPVTQTGDTASGKFGLELELRPL